MNIDLLSLVDNGSHNDSGRIEAYIKSARHRLNMGMDDAGAYADLVSCHVDPDMADLACAAAKILMRDEG